MPPEMTDPQIAPANGAAERPQTALESSAIPIGAMRCSICGHAAGLHEALQGPCHHGEGQGQRCTCTGFGGQEFKPAERGVAEPPRTLPVRPASGKGQPLRGPHPATVAIEEEARAKRPTDPAPAPELRAAVPVGQPEVLSALLVRQRVKLAAERAVTVWAEMDGVPSGGFRDADFDCLVNVVVDELLGDGLGAMVRDRAAPTPLAVGSVVRLKSGGPLMTVNDPEGPTVECFYFEGGDLRKVHFPPAALTTPRDHH